MSKLLTTNDPYDHNIYSIKQYGHDMVRITYIKSCRQAGWEELELKPKKKRGSNPAKLDNNLARAKSTVREYALCNPWDWWVTLTIDSQKYDRFNLDDFYKKFSQYINNYNKRHEEPIKYVLVPEQHEDGAWHLHGFIKGIPQHEIYTNQYGYLSWSGYDKRFGFISMSPIKNLDKASSYVLKYMTKDADKNVTEQERHLYYASKGLLKAETLYKGKAFFKSDWDWEHEQGYCKIKTIRLHRDNLYDYIDIPDFAEE